MSAAPPSGTLAPDAPDAPAVVAEDGAGNDAARDLARELDWLAAVLHARLAAHFAASDPAASDPAALPPPALGASPHAALVRDCALGRAERLVLALALAPHLRPAALDPLWTRNAATERGFAEFGGWHGATHGGFLPTGETALFLLAGDDLGARLDAARVLEPDGALARHDLARVGPVGPGEPAASGALVLSSDALPRCTTGAPPRPSFGGDFPARRVRTRLAWGDLVLPAATLDQLEEVRAWLAHGRTLLDDWGMRPRLRAGFTTLFHGPPGTGKTLAACLLGRHCGCDVYRLDLSLVVSKWVGETERTLARVFDRAEHRRWILFFDEADALFGRRTRVDSAHDRYANQEVSFLLQRIEEFDGVVVLASNLKANIDEAFLRRFDAVVHFPMPRPAERRRIWERAVPPHAALGEGVDLARLAERHELSGGTIVNVLRHAALRALARGERTLRREDVEEGIRRELLKEGRTG